VGIAYNEAPHYAFLSTIVMLPLTWDQEFFLLLCRTLERYVIVYIILGTKSWRKEQHGGWNDILTFPEALPPLLMVLQLLQSPLSSTALILN